MQEFNPDVHAKTVESCILNFLLYSYWKTKALQSQTKYATLH